MPRMVIVFVVAVELLAFDTTASAQTVGTAVAVVNSVVESNARAGTGPRPVHVGDGITYGNTLTAGESSRGEFELIDLTRFVVDERASLVINDFVIERDRSLKRVTINVVSGAFRFISGSSGGESYQINTPVASLGVRGTAFDLYVQRGSGNMAVMLLEGAVSLCRRGGGCEQLTRPCQLAVVDGRDASARRLEPGTRSIAGTSFESAFPFLTQQNRLDPRSRVSGAERCARDLTEPHRDASGEIERQATAAPALAATPEPPPEPEKEKEKEKKHHHHGKHKHKAHGLDDKHRSFGYAGTPPRGEAFRDAGRRDGYRSLDRRGGFKAHGIDRDKRKSWRPRPD